MNHTTILVIDDSATIRRLVDSELSQCGYRVVTAANADEGLQRVTELRPDLILLDHQLPGTTGFELCSLFLEDPDLRDIPVVISSTLRKKAYAEYTELANAVDMLPKPYTGDLLRTTVANALETGAMVVKSQAQGTAVPEVIGELQDVTLSGRFDVFGLREVLDFLNNGSQQGVLEVEGEGHRVRFFLENGRIQGITATGIDTGIIAGGLPASLDDLAPVLNFTIGGRVCSEVDGLVELLDRKVLDPRLLRKLLRHQAAVLARLCFTRQLSSFCFHAGAPAPPMVRKLNLDVSLLALLVDGALNCDAGELPSETEETVYVRCNFRGQILDRAGLGATHMKVLGLLAEPAASAAVADRLGCDHEETRRVLNGFVLAELAEVKQQVRSRFVIALEHDPAGAQQIRDVLSDPSCGYSGRVVRDRLALELLLKRCRPDAILVAVDNDDCCALAAEIDESDDGTLQDLKWLAIGNLFSADSLPQVFGGVIERPFQAAMLKQTLDALFQSPVEELCPAVA